MVKYYKESHNGQSKEIFLCELCVSVAYAGAVAQRVECMKYVALLRGINVGKNNRIDMKSLKSMFDMAGYVNVSTYINSGNVIFESTKPAATIRHEIESALRSEFGLNVPTLVKTIKELQHIAGDIPAEWCNDETHRTDVAYLFKEVDSVKIIDRLPVRKEYIDIRYTKGALYWNVLRENYNKSNLNRLISHELYQYMTIRNINTARYLAGL